MVSVDLSDMESDSKTELVTFIEGKLPVKSERDGDVVTFEDKSPRSHVSGPNIRTYVKRYLHSNKLRKRYRLLSEDGSLRVVKQRLEEGEEEEEEQESKGKEKK